MAYENTAGLGVFNHFGPRFIQDGKVSGGKIRTAGVEQEAVIYVKGSDFSSGTFATRLTLPAGSKFLNAIAEVTEAFVLGGTTPTINVGTTGSAGTNYGIELSEAQGEALGTYYNATGAGTWANPLAAATAVSVTLDGTNPTVTSAGKAKIIIRYMKI